jgi:hypothetical protein
MLLLSRALLVAAVFSGAACSVYDPALPPYSNDDDAKDSGAPDPMKMDACAAGMQTEICNGQDDDCDGTTDEEEAVAADCASKLLNVKSVCRMAYCVKVGDCNPGFYTCDGKPENGCESNRPCEGGSDADAGPN